MIKVGASERGATQLQHITKAVIPAAGLGTRLAPLTRYMPKELLPVGGKPMIQYTIESYMASGISTLYIVVSPEKASLRNFITGDWSPPYLPFRRNNRFYDKVAQCNITFLVQEQPNGVADAVALAKDFIGNEPFACIMPDCLLFGQVPFAQQLIDVYENYGRNLIGTTLISGNDTRRFGNVGVLETEPLDERTISITSLSPKKDNPLCADRKQKLLKGFGGGIYLPEYFNLAVPACPNTKGEVDDVPIHHAMINNNGLLGVILKGAAFDAGHPLGFRAAVHFAGHRLISSDAL